MSFSFSKKERIKSRQLIDRLFAEGESRKKFPLKALFLELDDAENHQATFAVPKRSFKHAVARNRIKRQMKEAYRLQKNVLISKNGKKLAIVFIYISKDKPQYAHLASSMGALLQKVVS